MFKDKLQQLVDGSGKPFRIVCNDLGITSSCYTAWVNGQRIPYMKNLKRIAEYFHVSVTELLDGSVPRQGRTPVSTVSSPVSQSTSKRDALIEGKLSLLAGYRGLSLRELPSACGISATGLKSVLEGSTDFLDLYQTLANYFRVPVWMLLDPVELDADTITVSAWKSSNVYYIGRNMTCLRAMMGMPVSQVSAILQVSQVSYRGYEVGRTLCPMHLMRSVCGLYQLTARDITLNMLCSERVHDWFKCANAYDRIRYLKAMRDIKLGDLSLKCGLPQHSLVNYYRKDTLTEAIAKRVATELHVPLDWVFGDTPTIQDDTEIK